MTPLTNSLCDFGPPPPWPQRFNLADYVLTSAKADKDKIALTIVGGTDQPVQQLTYGEMKTRVLTTAAGLQAKGLQSGERLVLRIGHEIEFPVFFLAAAAIGAVPVPTSPMLSPHEARLIAVETEARSSSPRPAHKSKTRPARSFRQRIFNTPIRRHLQIPGPMILHTSSTRRDHPAAQKGSRMPIAPFGRGA